MAQTEVLVVGAGPAGLCAAQAAAALGASVTIVDREPRVGGQLVKQTHKFFGSKRQHAAERGLDIASRLGDAAVSCRRVSLLLDATVVGYYPDGVVLIEQNDSLRRLKPRRVIVATGAIEKAVAFPNNDLPGVYGAGAVQTLMNVHGVSPGRRVLMMGAGNIGLIVSYQLLQAGVQVAAVIDLLPTISGYWVHASKIRREGVPLYMSHAVKTVYGNDSVEGAIVHRVNHRHGPIPGTELDFTVDVVCIAAGLTPLTDLLRLAGCRLRYVAELGGYVPLRNDELETSVPGIYVAGDAAGVEEASTAMAEGLLAGAGAAASLGHGGSKYRSVRAEALRQLTALRRGPVGQSTLTGLEQVQSHG